MPLKIYADEKQVAVTLSGEIDHHDAAGLRERIDDSLRRWTPPVLILDFREVTFMDSSGIGLVMGRYRLVCQWDGRVIIRNPSPSIRKVMRLAGLERIAGIENTPPGTELYPKQKEEKS